MLHISPFVRPIVYFLVKLPSGGIGSLEHYDAGRSLAGFIFAFAFLPRGLTHRLCDRAINSSGTQRTSSTLSLGDAYSVGVRPCLLRVEDEAVDKVHGPLPFNLRAAGSIMQ